MAGQFAEGDGLTPNDAVLVARAFLREYIADLNGSTAEPHAEVHPDHVGRYGNAGLRVFRPETQTKNKSCLLDCVVDYVRRVEKKTEFEIGVKLITAPVLERDGEKIDPARILRSLIAIEGQEARIHIVKQLNDCWRRFACAKELAHIIMGMERGKIVLNPQIQLQLAFKIGDFAIDWSRGVSREVFAWLTAIRTSIAVLAPPVPTASDRCGG